MTSLTRHLSRQCKLVILTGLLTLTPLSGAVTTLPPACAQSGGGVGFGQVDLLRQVRETSDAMVEYRKSHEHTPQTSDELDDALKAVFAKISMTAANPTVTPQSSGVYRTYYQFRMTYDPSVKSITVINGKVIVPKNWTAPSNSVVIISDGNDTFAVWAAGDDEQPINDPTTNNPLVILKTIADSQSSK